MAVEINDLKKENYRKLKMRKYIYTEALVPACTFGSRVCYGVKQLQEGRICDTSPSHTLWWSVLWLMELLIMGDVPPGGQPGCYPPLSHHLCLYKGLWCCEFRRLLFKWTRRWIKFHHLNVLPLGVYWCWWSGSEDTSWRSTTSSFVFPT